MTLHWWVAVWLALGGPAQASAGQSGDLAAAKALYASGSYEEALTRLGPTSTGDNADEADQYRALCLLALGRTAETERSLEALVRRRPLFKMSEAEVSPRLVSLFHTVRRRLLPEAARSTYVRAKRSFDQKDYAAATTDLKTLQQILSDEDMDKTTPAASDLAMLAEGFLKLAEAEQAAAAARAAAAPAAAPPAAASGTATSPTGASGGTTREPAIYTIADADITPPVDLSRTLPAWRPPNAVLAAREHRGILRLVINELGRVESATLAQPITPTFDPLLIAAAKQWQFRPATKNGVAVKYLKDIPIVLSPVSR